MRIARTVTTGVGKGAVHRTIAGGPRIAAYPNDRRFTTVRSELRTLTIPCVCKARDRRFLLGPLAGHTHHHEQKSRPWPSPRASRKRKTRRRYAHLQAGQKSNGSF